MSGKLHTNAVLHPNTEHSLRVGRRLGGSVSSIGCPGVPKNSRLWDSFYAFIVCRCKNVPAPLAFPQHKYVRKNAMCVTRTGGGVFVQYLFKCLS